MIDFIESGLRTIKMEVEAVGLLSSRVDQHLVLLVKQFWHARGVLL